MCQVILSTFAFVLNRAKYIDVLCLLVEYYRHMDADELPEQSFLFHEFFVGLKPKQTPPATLAPTGPGHWKSLELNPRTTEKSETDQFGGQLQGRSRNLQF